MNTQTNDITNSVPMDKLIDELRLMAADAEELLVSAANQTGEGAAAARARIQKTLHVVKARLATAETAVIERTRQAAKATDEYVHDNPWKAIGISACAGVIVGMLVARR
jgi:ElaB/YqjD/DUF883 family membrane-anchored ribosome-binding protein